MERHKKMTENGDLFDTFRPFFSLVSTGASGGFSSFIRTAHKSCSGMRWSAGMTFRSSYHRQWTLIRLFAFEFSQPDRRL